MSDPKPALIADTEAVRGADTCGRLVAPCPHPKCQGSIKLAPDLPAGVYRCICHVCEVRWDGTTLTLERDDA